MGKPPTLKGLFDRKSCASYFQANIRCPKCRSEYIINSYKPLDDSHLKDNKPFLLPCGHNMCENCIYNNRQNLCCHICMRPYIFPLKFKNRNSNFKAKDFFNLDYFLIGCAFNSRSICQNRSNSNTSLLYSNSDLELTASSFSLEKCGECEETPAQGVCDNCNVLYCDQCFINVHRNSKVLKSHKLQCVEKTDDPNRKLILPQARYCKRHNKTCTCYCRKCRAICCRTCANEDHNKHGWGYMLQENLKFKEEIDDVLSEVNMYRGSVQKAQKVSEIQIDMMPELKAGFLYS